MPADQPARPVARTSPTAVAPALGIVAAGLFALTVSRGPVPGTADAAASDAASASSGAVPTKPAGPGPVPAPASPKPAPLPALPAPVHAWQLTTDRLGADGRFAPLAGPWSATPARKPKFETEAPRAMLLPGDAKAKDGLILDTAVRPDALPTKALTVEAWVAVDRFAEWGGIVSALQDNGAHERGFVLGLKADRFCFAVATGARPAMTYLPARHRLQPGAWYHVVGTWDGRTMRLYVDGRPAAEDATSRSGDIVHDERGTTVALGAYVDDNEHHPLAGKLESAAVWDRALDAGQVAALFARRKARFPDIDATFPAAVDWPTHLREPGRRGHSPEGLRFPLARQWTVHPRFAPRPGWMEEAKADYYNRRAGWGPRVDFDRTFHVTAVGERLFFGSSADDRVRCLDLATGRQIWEVVTEGPVRLAPLVLGDRVVFGSDDGCVYSVSAKDGVVQWRSRLAPADRRIPGNERLVSAWPVRTDVVEVDGRLVACAGVFPSQGVWQCSLDPATGRILERKALAVTAQGYLETVGGRLRLGTGRDLAGTFVLTLARRGKEVGKAANDFADKYPFSFVAAGIGDDEVRIAGGDGVLAAFSAKDAREVWSARLPGRVSGLAVVRGRVIACTDDGVIACYGPVPAGSAPAAVEHRPAAPQPALPEPAENDAESPKRIAATAAELVKQVGPAGYVLVSGAGDGRLVFELAARGRHRIVVAEPDARRLADLRTRIDAAGLADRVAVQHVRPVPPPVFAPPAAGAKPPAIPASALPAGPPPSPDEPAPELPYAGWVFNLVVHEESVRTGRALADAALVAHLKTLVRPHGGLAVWGPGESDRFTRGAPPGEGEWTHLYAEPANSACSQERGLDGELRLLWFGPPGPAQLIDRHHRTAAPLYKAGRLLMPGEDIVIGVDAYNGTVLWKRDLPGARRVAVFRDSSHLALAPEALMVAVGDACLALDPATGATLRTHRVPDTIGGGPWEWGYVAVTGDLLIGSAVRKGAIRREQSRQNTLDTTHWDFVPAVGSEAVFAVRRSDGRVLWTWTTPAGMVLNPSLAVHAGRLLMVHGAKADVKAAVPGRARLRELFAGGAVMTALDLADGRPVWTRTDVTFAAEHNLFLVAAGDRIAVVGSRNRGTDKKTATLLYDVQVFDSADGRPVWSATQDQEVTINGEHGEQERHPTVVGGRLYCEPRCYDLRTGGRLDWNWPWVARKQRRGCGTFTAAADKLFFRSDTALLFDLDADRVGKLTTETRPGCWINLLPAGGLLLAPEASSGCTCAHSVQTSFALVPVVDPRLPPTATGGSADTPVGGAK